jgi:pimeloyl-ACP methyl ester carboxylesterase
MLFRIVLGVLVGYSLFCLYLFFIQEKLIFPASQDDFDKCSAMKGQNAHPKRIGLARYYYRKLDNPKGIYIHFHGNGGTACHRTNYLEQLKDLPLDMVFVEYPGYANDGRKPSQEEILKEASEIYAHFEKMKLPIILYGESLGTGVSTYLASKNDVSGLILQSPYTSIADVAQSHHPTLPIKFLIRHRFPADEWAKNVKATPLIIYALKDPVVPPNLTKKQIPNFTEAEVVPLETELHGAMDLHHPDIFWGSIKSYISKRIDPKIQQAQ